MKSAALAAQSHTGTTLIRDARDADMPAIHAIYAHHVANGFGSFEEMPPDLAELTRRRTDFLARGLPYLVAELEGRVAGYAYVSPFRPRSAYRFTVENSIYVDPAATRRGLGRRLLAALIAQCTALGFRQMVAVIGDSQNSSSIRLHEALGFRHAGRLVSVGRKKGRWLDCVLMQLTLGPGDTTEPPA
ncbi:MAG: GNAT family N-acetyltransferase [Alphaproteobacteria bacterium]